MSSDGTDVVRLTHDEGRDSDPTWSPDGSRIAYSSAREDGQRIYLVGADGSDERPLTFGPADVSPAWSADGHELVYVADANGGDYTAFVVSLETGDTHLLTHGVLRVAWQPIPNHDPTCTRVGTSSDDIVGGGNDSDVVCGGTGADHIKGGPGLDILRGGDGDDVLDARDGVADVVDGGKGFDSAVVDRGDRTVNVEKVSFPEPRNVARGRPVTTSWDWADSSAEFAVDGRGRGSPLWWGSYYPPQWIEIDLGGAKTVRSVELVVAQLGRDETVHVIRGRDSNGTLKLLGAFARLTGDDDVIRIRPKRPWRGISAIRISTVEHPGWVAWKEIRVLR
jgi:dipeptidyl aminopeptidase/acylaminoacyl peptidase